jgi:hypothetical protein
MSGVISFGLTVFTWEELNLFPETVKDYKALFINYGDSEALRHESN